MLIRLRFCSLWLGLAGVLALAAPARANLPGGGTGTGANVTLTSTGTTATLSNGIVAIVCSISSASLSQINYTYNNGAGNQTLQVLSGGKDGGEFYWETGGFGTGSFVYSTVVNPAVGDANHPAGSYGEIDLLLNSATNGTMDVHFSMLRGSPGFYVTAIWSHRASDVAMGTGEERDNIYIAPYFNWMSVDGPHDREFDGNLTTEVPADFSTAENALVVTGPLQGTYDDKYKFCANFGVERAWGWSSVSNSTIGVTGKNIGIWHILASSEFYNGGPLKPELMDAPMVNMTNGGHYYMGGDSNFGAGEIWTRVSGPYFIYLNNTNITTTDPVQASRALFDDAQAQAAAEATAWPYSWFVNTNYTLASGRGNVTGHFVINDPDNPNASPANLWVGVIQQPITITGNYDFQQWMKPYQFWVQTDANGNFTIPHVIAGSNYTLYAFGPAIAGTFMSQYQSGSTGPLLYNVPATPFHVVVTGGNTTALGNVTWTAFRVGPTVWEIGYPDRTGAKFRHGDDYWVGDVGPSPTEPSPIWTKFLEYPYDFPNGVNYTVGASQWPTGWNFIQPIVSDSQGNCDPTNSTINFTLTSAPAPGATASLYLGTSSDDSGPLEITVNGINLGGNSSITATPNPLPNTGYFPWSSSSDTSIRENNHAVFSDERVTFPASMLHLGNNSINLDMRRGGYFANHAMYDYLRLELTGYVPPAPPAPAAYANNNAMLLSWPVQPGATSYNLLRSTTSGSGYATLATNITGPVCGSGPANATYVDTTAANGSTYYYVVQSVNPVGTSANSTQSLAASPSSSASTSAPAAPTGLAVTSVGNATINLGWTASPGASYYTVYRGTIVNLLGYIPSNTTLSNTVTGTTFTDSTPTNGSQYSYFVTATNAAGTSANSASVTGKAVPNGPASPPANFTVTGGNGTETLNWSAVPGAVGYVISRSTSPTGPFTYVMSVFTTTYTDTGLSNNTQYYYTVSAMNAAGASSNATVNGNTAPAAPSVTALGGTGTVTLSWAAVSGAANYTIQRSTSSGTGYSTISSGITNTTDTDTGRSNGTTYYYEVEAVNSTGAVSGASTEVAVTPLASPAGLTLAGHTGNITLAWSAAAAAGNYTVYRGTATGGPYSTTAGTVTSANLTDTTVSTGTPYYYVIAAANTTTDAATTLASNSFSTNSTQVTATPLAAPASPAASVSNGNATISWNAVPGATSYDIFRSTTTGANYTSINSTLTASPYVDPTLTPGITYYYVIAAQAPNSLGSNSTQVSAILIAAPANLTAAAGTANISLAWSPVAGASSYVVKRGTTTGGPYTLLTSSDTLTTYLDPNLTNGTPYYYVVETLASGSLSANSNEATATPLATPANLTATPGNANVTLNWNAAAGATAYTILRSTTSGAGYATLATGVTALTYKDSTAANGTTYYYTVTATNAAGASTPSTQTSATPAPPPLAPTNLVATPGNATIALTWTASANATTYTLQRSTTSGTGYAILNTTTTNSYTDSGLTNGITYYYIITATNNAGASPASAPVAATPAQTFAQWIAAYYPGTSDPTLIGPTADPDGDGLPNLEEYLLGSNPTTPDNPATLLATATDGAGNLVLTFHLSKNLTGLTYQVQQSTDLLNWTNTTVTPSTLSDQGSYYLMQAPVPLGPSPKLFLRLNVSE